MRSEVADLARTLAWTATSIAEADTGEGIRIAAAYYEAQALVAPIAPDHGSKRPRIVAWLEQFNILKDAHDMAACGWMLVAVLQRISEQDLPEWEKLDSVAQTAFRLLKFGAPRLH